MKGPLSFLHPFLSFVNLNTGAILDCFDICYTLTGMLKLHLIAHNIRSAENVGSLFRTADALGAAKIWIAGYSPGPEHVKVQKTALGAEKSVAWEREEDAKKLFDILRAEGFRMVGLELDPRAVRLDVYQPSADKVALVLGNEVDGIPPWVRDMCDDLIFIPQHGIKESLNVSVAAAIASYSILVNSTH